MNIKAKRIKFTTVTLLFAVIIYTLICGVCTEIIGRKGEIGEIRQYFNSIAEEIEHIYKTGSEEKLYAYLDSLVIHPHVQYIARPYVRYAVRCKNGNPEVLYTDEAHVCFKRLSAMDKLKINANMENITLEGNISLENSGGKSDKILYLVLFKDREYGLFIDTTQKILLSGIIIVILLALVLSRVVHHRIYKPLEEINEFVNDLAVGETTENLKTDSSEVKEIAGPLHEIKKQLQSMRNADETVCKEIITDILDIMKEIIKGHGRYDEIYDNIVKTVCRKITGAICCSLWLGNFSETGGKLKICRKAVYYFEDRFSAGVLIPVAETLVKEAMQSGKVKIIRDFEKNIKYKDLKESHPLALMVIPVRIKGDIVGSICIWKSRIPYSEIFSLKTRKLADYLGKTVGSIMEGFDYMLIDKG